MKPEKIQSLLAMSIAILALVISVWQGYEQRRHNRLSVKPLLNLDGISSNNSRSIRLTNNGLGPAIVKRFMIIEGGKVLDAGEGNPWSRLSIYPQINYSEMYYFDATATIKPEANYSLLTWENDSLRRLNIEIVIEYESIYEEQFILRDDF